MVASCIQDLDQADRPLLAAVPENDSDTTDSTTHRSRHQLVTSVSDRKSRDDDITSVSVQSRSYSDSGGMP